MDAIKHAETYVSARLSVLKTLFAIIKLEARLAGLSVFPLIVNVCMLFVVLMSVWMCTSILIGYGILYYSGHVFLSLLLVFLLNLGVLGMLTSYLVFNLKNMSFEKTRAYFAQKKGRDDAPITKAATCPDRLDE